MELTYEERIAAQIAQYAETVNMHELPDIFHIWSSEYIGPPFREVFKAASVNHAYAMAFMEATTRTRGNGRLLSIGCGDGQVEIAVAKILIENGHKNFKFHCADLSPILLGHLKRSVQQEGLEDYFIPIEADLNRTKVDHLFDVIMANHALHHIEALEDLAKFSFDHMTEAGIFATCDVIGRNGHRRWIEADVFVQSIWPMLSPTQQYHLQLKRRQDHFIDHDCSTEGFEGIRAQDIMPIWLQTFHPYKFVGSGGLADLFVDRGYGHSFDKNKPSDVALIRHICDLNEILLDAGVITPTWTMAYFTKDKREQVFYRNRTAERAVRNPLVSPKWTKYYQASPSS